MTRHIWRVGRITGGALCLGVGVVGFFVPLLPGIVLVLVGLTVLSKDSRYAHGVLTWLREHVHRPHRAAVPRVARRSVNDAG
jgi:uncharacterized membrane protein YbaN (DUF454 family)